MNNKIDLISDNYRKSYNISDTKFGRSIYSGHLVSTFFLFNKFKLNLRGNITSKIVLDLFVFVDDVVRFFHWLFMKISSSFKKRESKETVRKGKYISRSEFIIRTGLLIGSIPFFSMIYGMAFNPYNYKVRKLRLILPALPVSFDGFRIVQVSDIHTGSFLRTEPLARAVKIINQQKPDVVFFTGDLVKPLCPLSHSKINYQLFFLK